MKSLIALLSIVALAACTKEVIVPTGSEAPPDAKQCDVIAAQGHYTPEQRAELCDCYELEELRHRGPAHGWWRYVVCDEDSYRDDSCDIPDAETRGWNWLVRRAPEMMDQVEAAKALVGERCGENPFNTLALLAVELQRVNICARGPWADALAVRASGDVIEEYHSVAFTDGCWYGPAYKGSWYFGG